MWCLFGYYWYVVSRNQINRSSLEALGILAVIILVGLVITFWWVAHNKKLAHRNRRNTAPATVPETFDYDFLGRPLSRPGLGHLQIAQVIDIDIQSGNADDPADIERKIYSTPAKGGR